MGNSRADPARYFAGEYDKNLQDTQEMISISIMGDQKSVMNDEKGGEYL